MTISSIEELIAFAVRQEEKSSEFYHQAALLAPDKRSRLLLEELAGEELEHRKQIIGIGADGSGLPSFSVPPGKLVSEFLTEIPLHDGMSFTEMMIYAIKKEEHACRLYRKLAAAAPDLRLAAMMNRLADVEQTHKVRLEEYFLIEVSSVI
jgi:rubrerythrin